jgi:hypothetical protein
MSQYFSRLAARSAVVGTAASEQPRNSVANENVAWGEQNTELVVSGATPLNGNTSSASSENHFSADVAASGSQEKIPTRAVFENKTNTLNAFEDSGISAPENRSVTSSSMNTISKSTTVEQLQATVAPNRKSEHHIEKNSFNTITSSMHDGNADGKTASTYSERASASVLPEPSSSARQSKLPKTVASPAAQKENTVSRAEKNTAMNMGAARTAYGDTVAAPASFKTASHAIEISGNKGHERVSSRPPGNSEVSERIAVPSSRSHTHVHIGKIELEIYGAPQKAARPAPVQYNPAPVAAAKRTTGFNPSRHYLRSR